MHTPDDPLDRPQAVENPMSVTEAILERRSVRKYHKRAIPENVVLELVDICRRAPSSMDGQPWSFIVVRDEGAKRRLAQVKTSHCPPEKQAYPCDFMATAPLVIAVCVDRRRAHDRAQENGTLAAAFLMLAAHERGIGSVYLTAQREGDASLPREISAVLALPPEIEPIALIPLGYPAETAPPKTLRPLTEMVHHESYVAGVPPTD